MEEHSKIKISDIYKALKSAESLSQLNLFESDVIDHDIQVSDRFLFECMNRINTYTDTLNAAIACNDKKAIVDSLTHIRVDCMAIASDFDNLKDDIDSLIDAL